MGPGPEVRQEHSEEDVEVNVGDECCLLAPELLAVEEPHRETEEASHQEDGGWNEERDELLRHPTDGGHGLRLHAAEREGGQAREDDRAPDDRLLELGRGPAGEGEAGDCDGEPPGEGGYHEMCLSE